MSVIDLNGWNARRLDTLARDVAETRDDVSVIKKDIAAMKSDEVEQLRQDLRDARERPRLQLTGFILPLMAASIPSAVVLITHYA